MTAGQPAVCDDSRECGKGVAVAATWKRMGGKPRHCKKKKKSRAVASDPNCHDGQMEWPINDIGKEVEQPSIKAVASTALQT